MKKQARQRGMENEEYGDKRTVIIKTVLLAVHPLLIRNSVQELRIKCLRLLI